MTALEPLEPSVDPALAALADAILIPPFPGHHGSRVVPPGA
jgi:hypothetical protein